MGLNVFGCVPQRGCCVNATERFKDDFEMIVQKSKDVIMPVVYILNWFCRRYYFPHLSVISYQIDQ